ncbi:U8 snoRNA-decapping enzyme [Mugil cephalus]|uniref:U8 snoRNA-decapping enzyme n=1 Tax=Mugil cephalus TaxID=48193 RepID=UPI001FB63B79|nr:U8 snoRNA-decapping enzyme [Mugil cephalus]
MASGQLSRAEALASSGYRHACHVMLYCDTKSELFGRFPFRHIILMQMRFDGLLGFPGGLVDQSKETLEAGLSRELSEELGLAIPVTEEDLVESCFAPASPFQRSPNLILHFYVKKIEEELVNEVERVAASTAADHGQEVLGMVRVPLYTMRNGGGLSHFLSHSFIGNARSQLVRSLLRLDMVPAAELHKALAASLKTQAQSRDGLREALALTEAHKL